LDEETDAGGAGNDGDDESGEGGVTHEERLS
jgi:hypothetical protein